MGDLNEKKMVNFLGRKIFGGFLMKKKCISEKSKVKRLFVIDFKIGNVSAITPQTFDRLTSKIQLNLSDYS